MTAGFFYLDDTEVSIVWAYARRRRCVKYFDDTELGARLARAMRKACPVEGSTWSKFLTVYLKPGQDIPAHEHPEHTLLWYPDGSLTHLLPGTTHGVGRVEVERLSVAMLVSGPVADS